MVVEHHGGMKRFGRMSGSVRLPTWTARLLIVVAVVTMWMFAIGQVAAAAFAGGALLIVLVATILEACRLEAAITLAADTVAAELDAEEAMFLISASLAPATGPSLAGDLSLCHRHPSADHERIPVEDHDPVF
jgi:hypothetical protein